MKQLFDNLSIQTSRLCTQTYSTSFTMGIRLLHHKHRAPICNIYGFVRFADEIVDSFHGYDKKKLLNQFRANTFEAIEEKISLNPILNAFQKTVNEFDIGLDLIDTFLNSMEMDLDKKQYNRKEYETYILGSAEVVGLMCLKVFTQDNNTLYEQLTEPAKKLGSAFQKINFLRDLKDDFEVLGRTYFPGITIEEFKASKHKIEEEIELDLVMALKGIEQLPASSKKGVYLAYVYYKTLFKKIRKTPASNILKERIRINNGKKITLMINSLLRFNLNTL